MRFLPRSRSELLRVWEYVCDEATYGEELEQNFGIVFNSLFTMTNMPIKRFADLLHKQGRLQEYMQLLIDSFNPSTLDHIMCRSTSRPTRRNALQGRRTGCWHPP